MWLDLSPIPPAQIQRRFPKIIQVCQRWGIDVFTQPIPVAPAAHYWMGGIATDLQGQTSIPGLYAVGEVASTGVHGANRLASNSLLECLVFAAQVAEAVMAHSPARSIERESTQTEPGREPPVPMDWPGSPPWLQDLRRQLPQLVWQSAGICRDAQTLEAAIAQVQSWRQQLQALPLSQWATTLQPSPSGQPLPSQADRTLRDWAETRNLLAISHLILTSAHFRTESRGGHYRRDFPQPDPDWQVHTLVQGEQWFRSASIGTQPPSAAP